MLVDGQYGVKENDLVAVKFTVLVPPGMIVPVFKTELLKSSPP